MPAKKGWDLVSDKAQVSQQSTYSMMYASHVGGTPSQKPLCSPLHKIGDNQRQGYTNKRRVVADEEKGSEKYSKRPEEYEATQEPSRVLDTWDGELSRISISIEASFHEGATPLPSSVHLLRRDLRCLAVVVLSESVGAIL